MIQNIPEELSFVTNPQAQLYYFKTFWGVFHFVLSSQLKRSVIYSNKNDIYVLIYELPNNLKLWILGNYEILGKSQNQTEYNLVPKLLNKVRIR